VVRELLDAAVRRELVGPPAVTLRVGMTPELIALESRLTPGVREVVVSPLDPWRVVFDGRYKLVTGYDTDVESPRWTGDKDQFTAFLESDRSLEAKQDPHDPLLWGLAEDPHETQTVADSHPETVSRLAGHPPDVPPDLVR